MTVLLDAAHMTHTYAMCAQMGSPEDVKGRERVTITMAPAGGLWMHAEPRKHSQAALDKSQ